MIKTYNSYFCLCLILIIFSCNKRNTSANKVNEIIDVQCKVLEWKLDKDFEIKDMVDTVEFIKLEDNSESMITSIDKLILKGNRIYILDITGPHKLLVFDKDGTFSHRIGAQGEGPGEYSRSMLNFDVDVQNEQILLFDYAKKNIMFYDLDGKFLNSIKSRFTFNDFCILQNGRYLLSLDIFESNNDYRKIAFTDDFDRMLKSYFSFSKEYKNDRLNARSFQLNDDLISYMNPVNDSLVIFNRFGEIRDLYFFDFKNSKLPEELKNHYEKAIQSRKSGNSYVYIHQTPIIIKDYIITSLFVGDQKGIAVFNTANNELSYEILNPKTFDMKNINFPLCTIGDSIVVSYIDSNLFPAIEKEIVLSEELKSHLQNGGMVLCLNRIK